MDRLFRLGQRSKSEVSPEEWGARWNETYEHKIVMVRHFEPFMATYNHPDANTPPLTQDEFVAFLEAHSHNLERLDESRQRFEDVKPDGRLSRLHMEAVKSLRSSLEHTNNRLNLLVLHLQGDLRGAEKAMKTVENSKFIGNNIYKKLSAELRAVKQRDPALYQQLGLSRDLLSTYELD